MKAFINIGCHGRKNAGLTICPGITERLFDLRLIVDKRPVLDYLASHIKLFDQVAVDHNKINNTVQFFVAQKCVSRQRELAIQEFLAVHRKCNIYMYVDPLDDDI